MSTQTVTTDSKLTDDEAIEQALTNVEVGDELTIEAEGDGERYKDHRVVQFVEYTGHFQFGEPIADVGRVVKPEHQMIYELGDSPTEPLTNGMEITAVEVFGGVSDE